MKIRRFTAAFSLTLLGLQAFCQSAAQTPNDYTKDAAAHHKFSVLTSWHSFTNWMGDNIEMYELHFGYRVTSKDKIGVKAAHWKLFQPLGIPMSSPELMDKSQYYPGRLREFGAGVFYQHILWKGLFASIEIMPLKKTYLDMNDNKTGEGFRLYTSYHLGYHIPLFKGRAFIEPQLHCNYWPIDTGYPNGFEKIERNWNNYFLFEPNIYIGVNF